jgi:hypothetical protein
MARVTLDTNCVIDLEQGTGSSNDLRELVSLHEAGEIELCVVAIAASERKRDGSYAKTFEEFKERLDDASLNSLRILRPVDYWGMAFWGWFLWPGPDDAKKLSAIHRILFPEIEDSYADYCASRGIESKLRPIDRTWRNAKCDVITLWAHLHYEGDILVTDDGDFHALSKQDPLRELGVGSVVRSSEALSLVRDRLRCAAP